MASNNINFKIGSSFQGEGFKNATEAIRQNRQEIQAAKTGLGDLRNAFASISPEAATAVSGVENFARAFVTGGIIGGSIQLAIQGIAWIVKEVKESFDAAAEATAAYANIIRENLIGATDAAKASYSELVMQMQQANAEAQDLANVLNGDAAHEAQNQIFQIRTEAYQQMMDADSEAAQQFINANAQHAEKLVTLGLAEEQAANTIDLRREQLDAQAQIMAEAQNRVAVATDSLTQVQEMCKEYINQRAQIENALAAHEQLFADGHIGLPEILQARKDSELALKNLNDANQQQISQLNQATSEKTAAINNAAEQTRIYAEKQQALHLAVQKHDESEQDIALENTKWAASQEEWLAKLEEANTKRQEAAAKEELAALDLTMGIDKVIEGYDKLTEAVNNEADRHDAVDPGNDKDDSAEGMKVQVTNADAIGSSFSTGINMDGVREDITKPEKLDDETYQRIKDGTANLADEAKYDRYMDRERRNNKADYDRIRADTVKFLNAIDDPNALVKQSTATFVNDYVEKMVPKLSPDLAKELLGSASEKLLTSSKLQEALKKGDLIDAWMDKFATKVKIQ